jgi:hypothetical protein
MYKLFPLASSSLILYGLMFFILSNITWVLQMEVGSQDRVTVVEKLGAWTAQRLEMS